MKRDIEPETGLLWANLNKTEEQQLRNAAAVLNEIAYIEHHDPTGADAREAQEAIQKVLAAHREPPGSEVLLTGANHDGQKEDPFEPPKKPR